MPNHPEDEDFQALGKMLAGAGRLEGVAYQVARALAVADPERQQVAGVIAQAARQASESLPPWSSADLVDQQRLIRWLNHTKALLDRRNGLVHVSWMMQRQEHAWVLSLIRTKTGEIAPFSRSDVLALVEDLTQAWRCGLDLHSGLLHRVRDGVYVKHPRFRRDTDPGVVLSTLADGSTQPEPMSDEEFNAWHAALPHVVPFTWWTWPWP